MQNLFHSEGPTIMLIITQKGLKLNTLIRVIIAQKIVLPNWADQKKVLSTELDLNYLSKLSNLHICYPFSS